VTVVDVDDVVDAVVVLLVPVVLLGVCVTLVLVLTVAVPVFVVVVLLSVMEVVLLVAVSVTVWDAVVVVLLVVGVVVMVSVVVVLMVEVGVVVDDFDVVVSVVEVAVAVFVVVCVVVEVGVVVVVVVLVGVVVVLVGVVVLDVVVAVVSVAVGPNNSRVGGEITVGTNACRGAADSSFSDSVAFSSPDIYSPSRKSEAVLQSGLVPRLGVSFHMIQELKQTLTQLGVRDGWIQKIGRHKTGVCVSYCFDVLDYFRECRRVFLH
jgi:hypothetical protein